MTTRDDVLAWLRAPENGWTDCADAIEAGARLAEQGTTYSTLCEEDDCSTPDLCRGIGCQAIYARKLSQEPPT